MLRKTNINRASLRRAHNSVTEATPREIFEEQHSKTYSTNGENNTRPSTIVYNSTNRSKGATPTSNLSMSDSKESCNENEHWRINNKSSQSKNEQQDKYKSMIYWNNCENNSHSNKSWAENEQCRSDLKKSQAKNEQQGKKSWTENEQCNRSDFNKSEAENKEHGKASSKKTSYKNERCQSEIMRSQNKTEECGRTDSKEILSENEQHSSKNTSNLNNSLNENEQNNCKETTEQWKNRTEMTTTTELVPGLIIQGQVTDL
jgi:hypothetical protein